MPVTVYRLSFIAPLRLGHAQARLPLLTLHADWLFRAVQSAQAQLGQTPFAAGPDRPPLVLSSAFPFTGATCFAPAPRSVDDPSVGPAVDLREALGGRLAPISAAGVYELEQRPRATFARNGTRAERFSLPLAHFPEGAGLWFAARFADDATGQRLDAALRLLGDTGLGGGRSVGYGRFRFARAPLDEPTGNAAAAHWVLSRYLPAPGEAAHTSPGAAVAHSEQPVPIGPPPAPDATPDASEPHASHQPATTISYVAEGSVLAAIDGFAPETAGSAAHVPETHAPGAPWKTYRGGWLFALPLASEKAPAEPAEVAEVAVPRAPDATETAAVTAQPAGAASSTTPDGGPA